MTGTPDLPALTREHREGLVDTLEALTPDHWLAPSLCSEWRVVDVAAHLAWAPVLGAAAGWRLGLVGPLVPALLLIALLVPITFIDIEHRVIPDRLVFPGTAAALVVWALIDTGSLKEHGLAAVIACVVFLLMAIVYPAGMGLGDVKLALLLGAFLGTAVAPGLFIGFVISATRRASWMFCGDSERT